MQPAPNSTNTILQTYLACDRPKEVVIIQCNIQTQNGVAMADEVDALKEKERVTCNKGALNRLSRVLCERACGLRREAGVCCVRESIRRATDGKLACTMCVSWDGKLACTV